MLQRGPGSPACATVGPAHLSRGPGLTAGWAGVKQHIAGVESRGPFFSCAHDVWHLLSRGWDEVRRPCVLDLAAWVRSLDLVGGGLSEGALVPSEPSGSPHPQSNNPGQPVYLSF